jgi:hypothetical protein
MNKSFFGISDFIAISQIYLTINPEEAGFGFLAEPF